MAECPVPWPGTHGHADPVLRVIEWPKNVGRVLALCDTNSVVLEKPSPGIQAPGYHGCIAEWEGGVRIWARTWSEITDDCEDRLHFYPERLNHDPATEHAVEYLRRVHGETVPDAVMAR